MGLRGAVGEALRVWQVGVRPASVPARKEFGAQTQTVRERFLGKRQRREKQLLEAMGLANTFSGQRKGPGRLGVRRLRVT